MDSVRRQLAAAQAEVLASLLGVGGSPPTAGFDGDDLRRTAATLRHKRRRAVAARLPHTCRDLGPRFEPEFDRYAGDHPPLTAAREPDALRFARWLAGRCRLGDAARLEQLRLALACGARLAVRPLRERRRLALGLRWRGRALVLQAPYGWRPPDRRGAGSRAAT